MNDFEKILIEKGFHKTGDSWKYKNWELRKREDNWLLDFKQRTVMSSKNLIQVIEYFERRK